MCGRCWVWRIQWCCSCWRWRRLRLQVNKPASSSSTSSSCASGLHQPWCWLGPQSPKLKPGRWPGSPWLPGGVTPCLGLPRGSSLRLDWVSLGPGLQYRYWLFILKQRKGFPIRERVGCSHFFFLHQENLMKIKPTHFTSVVIGREPSSL